MADQYYPGGVVLAIASFLVTLLIIPPLCWHLRNRNIGATALVVWLIYLNFQSFVNALIWPGDEVANWFHGVALCDVEVKLQIASNVGAPAALCCILRALAKVMDTDRATMLRSKAQLRRETIIDVTICVVPAVLQMAFHFIVQPQRYYILTISGCVPAVSPTWVTILLMFMPPLIWALIDAYFSILVLIRLYRYRITFSTIVASSNTNKSRFLRLYLLCVIWIVGFMSVQAFVLSQNLTMYSRAYEWPDVHNDSTWTTMTTVPTGGIIFYDRYIWLASGTLVFLFFGLGKEALASYRAALCGLGLGRLFPTLRQSEHEQSQSRTSLASTLAEYGSKSRMFFTRQRSAELSTKSVSMTDSMSSRKQSINSDFTSETVEKQSDPV